MILQQKHAQNNTKYYNLNTINQAPTIIYNQTCTALYTHIYTYLYIYAYTYA